MRARRQHINIDIPKYLMSAMMSTRLKFGWCEKLISNLRSGGPSSLLRSDCKKKRERLVTG